MAIVGGFDVHRRQVTFDYLDTVTGQVRRITRRVPGTSLFDVADSIDPDRAARQPFFVADTR